MKRLEGKVAIVTGSAEGIGKATVALFAKEGARVLGVDINSQKGTKIIDEITHQGYNAVFVRADVSNANDVKRVVEKALDLGGPDILFNNAGTEVVKDLIDTTEEEWDRTMEVNLKSVFLFCKTIIPLMVRRGGGVIINNASVAGLVGSFSPAYSASKGGIIALTKVLAVELAQSNIRVNCICPGAIETPMLQRVLEKQGDPIVVRQQRVNSYPMGRFGNPEEIAHAALFLASDDSSFMTGVILPVDGGFIAR
jgi:NAD(P)-dependent dehydrogenase (short-subunit alcohol dehydrogenase family)